MATPSDTLSLVPVQDSAGGGFAQQGTIDWTRLGQMQFSGSIAILSRLAGAGIEPLTVAVAQTMCSRIPIGSHGEKVLTEALNNLKSFSSFADLVYFGVGVRHVLRTLVQTSQGAASVALCAALAEGHSVPAAALVMYEMTKLSGCDQELTPSFTQWEAFVRVCSCVFTSTNFGLRLGTLIQLMRKTENYQASAGHPVDIAKVLLALGTVTRGCVKRIDLSGGVSCCWIAIFAEFILGLRVSVYTSSEQVITRNFDGDIEEPQVCIRFATSSATNTVSCIGHVYTIPAGDGLLYDNLLATTNGPCSFPGGRTEWGNMISEAFGDIASPFVGGENDFYLCGPGKIEGKAIREAFAKILVSVAAQISRSSEICRYPTRQSFYECLWRVIPEIQASKRETIAADHDYCTYLSSISGTEQVYKEGTSALEKYCVCVIHNRHEKSRHGYVSADNCLVNFGGYLINLGLFLGRLDIPNVETLYPNVEGLRILVKLLPPQFFHGSQRLPSFDPTFSFEHTFERRLNMLKSTHDIIHFLTLPQIFQCVIALFSGYKTDKLSDRVSAMTDGRVYCYVNALAGLSDRLEVASQIRVGVGSIQAKLRQYPCVLDLAHGSNIERLDASLHSHNYEIVNESLSSVCRTDTTSPRLASVALVEESAHVVFWYRLSSELGSLDISPATSVDILCHANKYRVERGRLEEKIRAQQNTLIESHNGSQAASAKRRRGKNIRSRPTPTHVAMNEPRDGLKDANQNQLFAIRVLKIESLPLIPACLVSHNQKPKSPDFGITPCYDNQLGRIAALVHASHAVLSNPFEYESIVIALAPNEDRVQELLEVWAFYRQRKQVLEEKYTPDGEELKMETVDSNDKDDFESSEIYDRVLLIT